MVEVIEPAHTNGSQRALAAFLRIPGFLDSTSTPEAVITAPTGPLLHTLQALQQSLVDSLPRHMVPSYFIPLHVMPRSIAGKSDRKALRSIGRNLQSQQLRIFGLSGVSKREPTTELEQKIRLLWASVLNIPPEEIGLDDNFFKLGGDSLSAMRVVANARNDAGISITVGDMFKTPKLVDIASAAVYGEQGEDLMREVPLQPFELIRDAVTKQTIMEEIQSCGQYPVAVVEDAYPCTPLQEAMFAVTMSNPSAYVLQQTYQLPTGVDISRFEAAWDELVRTTPILRTCIVHTQQFGSYQAVYTTQVGLSKAEDLAGYLEADSKIPMRYGHMLSRCALVKAETINRYYFVWTAHHAAYDGHSLGLMLDQLQQIYEGQRIRHPSPYANFIQYVQAMDEQVSSSYWTQQLANLEAVDFPRLPTPLYRPQTTDSLHHIFEVPQMHGSGVTMATILYSAWALTLSRTSESTDIVFGLTQNGRTAPVKDIDTMFGPTMSTVPMRIQVDKNQQIKEFLEEVQYNVAGMIPHEQLGLQRIKRLNFDCQSASEFKNLFVVQNHESSSHLKTLLEPVKSASEGFMPYALLVECTLREQAVHIDMQFDGNVLSDSEAHGVLQRFDHVLRQLTCATDCARLKNIDFFTSHDSDLVFSSKSIYPNTVDACVHSLFRATALSKRNDPAVCSWDASFTYLELDRLTDRLAHRLVDAGVRTGSLVPVCFEKSAWAIVAMLAIMKAGGAFVPIDPSHPRDRLEQLVTDTQASVVLVSTSAPTFNMAMALEVSAATLESMPMPSKGFISSWPVDPSNSAYVLFTSGSTGKPKGVVIQHRAICTSMAAHSKAMVLTSQSRVYQFASYTFDLTIAEVFTTLTVGGCVCVPSDAERLSGDLAHSINRFGATWAFFTPTVLRLINPNETPTLETVVVGGEAVCQDNIDTWASRVRLVDGYGPTEACVFALSSVYPSTGGAPGSIGFPLGLRAWVVEPDDHNQLTPVGMAGELLLQGPTLAKEYLNDAEKTAAAFVKDPNWCRDEDESRRRFYKTGDLVRYKEDGSLIFVARKDAQVKVNGQRTEPAEVEHHIRRANAAVKPVVLLPKTGAYSKRLVAVVAADNTQYSLPLQALESTAMTILEQHVVSARQKMASQLPNYMIPTSWLAVSGFPQTTSSKMDRKKILAWVEGLQEGSLWQIDVDDAQVELTIPATDIQRKLQQVLSKVLNIPAAGIDLNKSFIGLGGDSITAMQVVSRCRAEGLDANVQNIISSKSISDLANLCTRLDETYSTDIEEETVDVPFQLSPIQLMFINSVIGHRFNQSFLLRLSRKQTSTAISRALDEIVQRHGMLRARFAKDASVQTWHQIVPTFTSGCYRFRHHQIVRVQDIAAAVQSSQDSVDAQNGPVFSVDLCDVEEGDQIILLVAHHLVVDLVSWRIIIQDLESLLTEGQTAITSSPLPFQSWVSLQRQYLGTSEVPVNTWPTTDLDFWQLDQSNNVYGNIIQSNFTLDSSATTALLGDCNAVFGTETVDILIGAVLQSFTTVFGEQRTPPVLFTEGHGREPLDNKIDLSATVGWFTTLCPIAIVGSNENNLVSTIRQVKDIRRSVPLNGFKTFASRFLSQKQDHYSNSSAGPMELVFNFAGQYQQLEARDALFQFQSRDASSGYVSDFGDDLQRSAVFEIGAIVSNGCLQFTFTYNRSMGRGDQTKRWINLCQMALKEASIIMPVMCKQYTKSDFLLMPWSETEFDRFSKTHLPRIGNFTINDIEDIYPATPLQQTLLLNQSKNPEHYAVHSTFQVLAPKGERLDIERLELAWRKVVDRHSALRTIFIEDALNQDVLVYQVVMKSLAADIVRLACGNEDPVDTLNKQQPLQTYTYRVPHRFSTCRTDSGLLFAKMEVTHAILDGLSTGILFRDLQQAYNGQVSLPQAPLYSSFVAHLQSLNEKKPLNYWSNYLADLEPNILPALREDIAEINTLQSIAVRISDLDSVQSFCRSFNVTLSSICQAAWSQVLRAFTNSDQVVFGYLNAGRDAPVAGLQDAVGLFINMLVCRVNFESPMTSSELVQQVHSDYINSLPHQHCSLASIQRQLGLNGQPMFSSVISYQSAPSGIQKPQTGISFEPVGVHDPTEVRCF
jgi:amino acid adenylation domain-containing protein/non-ribosomal peptide synthase protein (TIGR01720 family)